MGALESGRPAGVELRGWGWRHPGRLAWAACGLDLTVQPGERVLLLGPSGAGKSTLLRGLAGLLDPEVGDREGTITVDGTEPAEQVARGRVGYLQQDPESQLVMARAGDDVAFGLENLAQPVEDMWPAVRAAMAGVGFPYGLEHATTELSGGEQQRLALAGVLALRPGLLLLDEPTANLDPAGAVAVRAAIRAVLERTGATMVLVEHRITESLPLVDRIVVVAPGGGVEADGTPAEILGSYGDRLAEAGVWVPGRASVSARRATGAARVPLLRAAGVRVERRTELSTSDSSVLDGVDFTAYGGEVTALTGSNGAGKSTLARILGGLNAPTGGTVTATAELCGVGSRVARRPPWRWPAGVLASRIGSVFQDPEHQFLTARVRTELTVADRRRAVKPERVDELLVRLRLEHLAEANPFTLSGGEQRRLSVATALVAAPGLLVLDEPTFGQDRRTWGELVSLLAGLRDEGVGIVTVTHDEDLVDTLADRVVRLEGGRTVADSFSGESTRTEVAS